MNNLCDLLASRRTKLAVVGLGYVGLPLAHAFSLKYDVVGFDINHDKIELMRQGIDPTGEVPEGGLKNCSIDFTTDPAKLADCRFIVVAVPTPVDRNRRPNLAALRQSSSTVGEHMPRGALVVYESTVYPGVTEDECVPLLEKCSGLRCGEDFKVGYSPERINPGDQEHRLASVIKVVSGCDAETLEAVAAVYGSVVEAGVHRAPSIKVAEAAKVIENTQRDVNIALMNELSLIFHRLDIDTLEVLRAAGSKWNFLKFFPGLVGGHCIGVDPYYLTFKAEETGYHPEVILSGRRINDGMGKFVAENTVKMMIRAGKAVNPASLELRRVNERARVLILGLTFKENVSDIRNSKVVDIINELAEYDVQSYVYDPYASAEEVLHEYGGIIAAPLNSQHVPALLLSSLEAAPAVDAVILAVPHDKFKEMTLERLAGFCRKGADPVVIDIKGMFEPEMAVKLGIRYWRL
ncbi:MAG: nucleotide sugar dehydrogenase [Candidatus Riflebacteria bacterium HGW-Riflebacteria-1]|jgi:UDP-N-acetyl-D-galactosamine dehydrogenase|nr:MAG: nucleotide sugar dehydrogenase [Candidatus Riflebacteria bacterium HGW-Riflebacteria-1]